jgi:hypothetical protein
MLPTKAASSNQQLSPACNLCASNAQSACEVNMGLLHVVDSSAPRDGPMPYVLRSPSMYGGGDGKSQSAAQSVRIAAHASLRPRPHNRKADSRRKFVILPRALPARLRAKGAKLGDAACEARAALPHAAVGKAGLDGQHLGSIVGGGAADPGRFRHRTKRSDNYLRGGGLNGGYRECNAGHECKALHALLPENLAKHTQKL